MTGDRSDRWSLAVLTGLLGLIIGLATPAYLFADRLTRQEEKMSQVIVSQSEMKTTISQLTNALISGESKQREKK